MHRALLEMEYLGMDLYGTKAPFGTVDLPLLTPSAAGNSGAILLALPWHCLPWCAKHGEWEFGQFSVACRIT